MDMALHRYGGGLSVDAIERLMAVPFTVLVRLVGAAKRSLESKKDGKRNAKPTSEEEAKIIAELEEKRKAALAAAKE